jgi:hypothetical protein
MASLVTLFQREWSSEDDQDDELQGPAPDNANSPPLKRPTTSTLRAWESEASSSEDDELLLELLLVSKRDRLLEFAKLRHRRMDSACAKIPKDVMRLIAQRVRPTIVVLSGGYESSPGGSPLARS